MTATGRTSTAVAGQLPLSLRASSLPGHVFADWRLCLDATSKCSSTGWPTWNPPA